MASIAALKSLQIIPRTPSPSPVLPSAEKDVEPVKRNEPDARVVSKQATNTQGVKREAKSGIKREADQEVNAVNDEGEVEFVSSKRLKGPPTQQDEVIVLD